MKYNMFINENLDTDGPKKINVGKKMMKLFISKSLREILQKLIISGDFQVKTVANKILNIDKEPDENSFDFSYVDIDKTKEDYVSFMPSQRAWRNMNWTTQEQADDIPSDNSPLWTAAGRQSISIGKFVNKVFDNFSEIAVDKFVRSYRAEITALQIYDRFKLVNGEDIRFWYAESNYHVDPSAGGGAGLPGSCMRYDGKVDRSKNTQKFLDIYCDNKDKCFLLILTNKENKLIGRALVWKELRKPIDKTFMDRIYAIKQSDVELFKKYASEQGWLYKYNQSAQDSSYMENGQRIDKSITVSLKAHRYNYYPYMDTLKYFTPDTGRLSSHPGVKIEGKDRYKMESTGGGAQKID